MNPRADTRKAFAHRFHLAPPSSLPQSEPVVVAVHNVYVGGNVLKISMTIENPSKSDIRSIIWVSEYLKCPAYSDLYGNQTTLRGKM